MNVSMQATGYRVGDSWTIIISGIPSVGRNMVVTGGKDGARDVTNMGKSGPDGTFTLSGKFDGSSVGKWHQDWSAQGTPVGTLDFTVEPMIIVAQSQATSGVTSQVPSATSTDTATSANVFDLFGTMDNQINVPGTGIQVGTYTAVLAVGALVVGYMMMNKGRR